MTLLRLITGPFGRPHGGSDVRDQAAAVIEEKKRGEEDLIDTVLEIVFRVMWKGVEGFGEDDWKVRNLLYSFIQYSFVHWFIHLFILSICCLYFLL